MTVLPNSGAGPAAILSIQPVRPPAKSNLADRTTSVVIIKIEIRTSVFIRLICWSRHDRSTQPSLTQLTLCFSFRPDDRTRRPQLLTRQGEAVDQCRSSCSAQAFDLSVWQEVQGFGIPESSVSLAV